MTTLTTTEAAALVGMTPSAFRGAMTRARQAGHDCRIPGPDARTPLWDADAVTAYLAGRPGRRTT